MLIRNRRYLAVPLLAVGSLLIGCADDIVYRDRPPFETPPEAAAGFLGYSNVAEGQTVCGNCHVGKQGEWEETAHADAWSALDGHGGAQQVCEACHSVSSLGNVTTDPNVAYVSTHHERYEDVQCESCHGPGLEHVQNPDGNPPPLAPIRVGVDLAYGCGECHSGAHNPFVEEWSASRHANFQTYRATNANCTSCHEPRAVLASWGVNSSFIEQAAGAGDSLAITCAVCHDPHERRHEGQLRFAIDDPDPELNLCMKCHHKRAVPEVNSTRGPHSPQGPLLLGEAGWIPPNFEYPPGALVGSHGPDGNPRMCASCHVNAYELTDPITGDFQFAATGHSFDPIPCVDGQGVPTGSDDCAIEERSFRSCTQCHTSESGARSALITARARLDRLAADIALLLPQIPASEFDITDNRVSTGEGSRFNRELALQPGSPIHNPFLVEALLLASIRQIELDYGLRPSADLSLTPQLAPR